VRKVVADQPDRWLNRLFNAIIGAVDLDTEEGRALVVRAITATGAEGARFRSLCDIILGVTVSDSAHEHLEELMGITYQEQVRRWLVPAGSRRWRGERHG
jgi:hypothetical protein